MKYPPENLGLISADEKILWMLSNNPKCRWKDFINEPIKIPSATLSKYIKRLNKDLGFIEKTFGDDGRPIYKITSKGEIELKKKLPYQTDFETILQIELDKNLNLINKFSEFFKINNIDDLKVQLEFIKLASIINPDKLKDFSEELQYTLLLFIVLNHPKFYPTYNLDVKSFIKNYSSTPIGKLTNHQIGFFLENVIDNDIYEVNFQKLEVKSILNDFYYSENSYYGSIFQNTIDEHLKNLFLIGRLTGRMIGKEDLLKTYGDIAYDLVEKTRLFHPDLKNSLYNLIEKYRKNIKDQMIKEPRRERIEDYTSIVSLPDVTDLDNEIKKISNLKRVSIKVDDSEENLIEYKTFGSSFKELDYVSKKNLSQKTWDLYEQKQYVPALKNIDRLLEIEESADLYYWKAEILSLKQKEYEKALQAIEKGILINPMPSGFNFYRLKADILYLKKQYKEALEAINLAIQIDSQEKLFLTKVKILLHAGYYNVDDIIEVIIDLEKSISHKIKEEFSNMIIKALSPYPEKKDVLKLLDVAILLNPNNYKAYYEKANQLFLLSNYKEAMKAINMSIDIAKKENFYGVTFGFSIIQIYGLKVRILKELGDTEGALKHYYIAKDVIDPNKSIAFDVGEVLEGIMSIDGIISEYNNLIRDFSKKNPYFYYYKALYLKKIKKFSEAEDLYEYLYTLDKKVSIGPDFLYDWFEMRMEKKDFKKAADLIEIDPYGILIDEIERFIEVGEKSLVLGILAFLNATPAKWSDYYIDIVIKAIETGELPIVDDIINFGFSIQDDNDYSIKEFKNNLKKEFFRRIKDEVQKENYKKVLKTLENYIQYDYKEAEAFRYKAIVFLHQKDTIQALKNINSAISLDPKNPKSYQIKSIVLYEMREFWDALELVNKAIELDPSNSENYGLKAEILNIKNKPHQAYKTLVKARELSQNSNLFNKQMSEILERLGRNNEALQEINKAIKSNLEKYWVYYKKAYILNKLGNFNEALENINKALEYEPHDFILIQDKLIILQNLNRIDEAIEILNKEKSVISSGDLFEQFKAQLFRDKAYNLMKSGEKDKSIIIIKEAIDLLPDWPEYYLSYGIILIHFGEYRNALEQLEIAKSLPLSPIETYIKIGKCLYELEQYEEALKNLELGLNLAKHSVKSVFLNEEDKSITVDSPQSELIEEAEKYISDVETKLNENK